jgi:hypothetical protein
MSCLCNVRSFLLAIVVTLTLGACSTAQMGGHANLPDKLGDTGVVIAEAYGTEGNFKIDGDTATYLTPFNRHLVMTLSPGEHTLDGLSFIKVVPQGVSFVTETITLPLNRKFRVEAGKVTNLGLILVASDQKDKDRFLTFTLDNMSTARRYFRESYPALSATLKDDDFLLAPGRYQPAANVSQLRRMIATDKALRNDLVLDQDTKNKLVVGPAGLVGEYVTQGGRAVDIRIFDTNTLANVVSTTSLGDRYLIAMSDGNLFLLDGGQLKPVASPAGAAPLVQAKLLPVGLVAVDARMVAYWSSDGGTHWSSFKGAELPAGEMLDEVKFAHGAGRLIAYTPPPAPPVPGRIIYTDEDKIAFHVLPTPEPLCWGMSVVNTKSGLFMGTCRHSPFKPLVTYFLPRDGTAWEDRAAPGGGVCTMTADPGAGTGLNAKCTGDNFIAIYRSSDDSRSWQRLGPR